MVEILCFLFGGIIGILGFYGGLKIQYIKAGKSKEPEVQENIKLINEWLNGGNDDGRNNK